MWHVYSSLHIFRNGMLCAILMIQSLGKAVEGKYYFFFITKNITANAVGIKL